MRRTGAELTILMLVALAPVHCGGQGPASSDLCRLEPQRCEGGAGTICIDDRDCLAGLYCCTEKSNCGGGMCTFACDGDPQCPPDMLCEHKKCFYRCADDRDCAPGQTCEHGNTICEYP